MRKPEETTRGLDASDRPNPAATLAAHIKLSPQAAAQFEITPETTAKALAADYKNNLY